MDLHMPRMCIFFGGGGGDRVEKIDEFVLRLKGLHSLYMDENEMTEVPRCMFACSCV